jgi:hypothetical protein
MWKEVCGFASPGEYHRFVRYIEDQVASGVVRELRVDPLYGKGMIYGGQWFQNLETGGVWRLIQPDPPFPGCWEPVAPFPFDYVD